MPNRYLRATFIDSKRINNLSAEAERMFIRLIVYVDDFGRCESDNDLLLGKLFARQLDRVRIKDIAGWLKELQDNDLLFIYEVDGCQYIQVNRWERGRAQSSKFPCPNDGANVYVNIPQTKSKIAPKTDPVSEKNFDLFWTAYPRHVSKSAARKAFINAECLPPIEQLLEAIDRQKLSQQWQSDNGKFIPHPATWIRQERWNDEMEINVEKKKAGNFDE